MPTQSKYSPINSFVRIITPNAFIRCGYPLTHNILCDTRGEEVFRMADKLYALLYSQPEPSIEVLSDFGVLNISASNIQDKEQRVYDYLTSAVCSKMLRDLNWGGKERKIFEEPIEPYRLHTKEWKVEKKRFVKTGTHFPAWSGRSDYSGEWDYEPGGLGNEKTHCIYTISSDGDQLDILATNCERIISI